MKSFASALVSVAVATEAEQYNLRLDHYLYNREPPVSTAVDQKQLLRDLYAGEQHPAADFSKPGKPMPPAYSPYEFLY